MDSTFRNYLGQLEELDHSKMYNNDFLHTWDKTTNELRALYLVADALRNLRERNVSTRIFDSGLAVSNFRDNSTRTRFSFASGTNMLGLQLQDLDESKSQIAHGETVRETATMISFMADVIGILAGHKDGWGMAYWFQSVNGFLGGKRPQDLLATDPDRVIAAARDEVQGVLHG